MCVCECVNIVCVCYFIVYCMCLFQRDCVQKVVGVGVGWDDRSCGANVLTATGWMNGNCCDDDDGEASWRPFLRTLVIWMTGIQQSQEGK